jgi:alpha-N-arabinofuranosidase
VKIANMAQMVNVIAPIFTSVKGMFLQTIYYPLQLFANNSRGKALDLLVDSPKYASKRFGDVRYLDTSAAFDNGTLVLNVVNRHRDQMIEAEFTAEDKHFSGAVEVAEVNGPDIKSENNFDSISVQTARKSATANGKQMVYGFPPHSYTMLKVKLV